MEKSIRDSLCKGLRACGIPVKQSHQILNEVEKWTDHNGPKWTVDRIKGLRQWYETSLTGDPKPPDWFRHSETKMPLGVWSWVFKLPTATALGALSLGTVFYEHAVSVDQEEKFFHGLDGSGTQSVDRVEALIRGAGVTAPTFGWRDDASMSQIPFPTLFDMNGSVPFNQGRSVVRPGENLGSALEAEVRSWEDIPEATFEFLGQEALWGMAPLDVLGNEYALELSRKRTNVVGRVGVTQGPELKARFFANTNRIIQVTLDPLKHLYMSVARRLPTDVTFDQEEGVRWCKEQLAAGVTLAGSDLTSASDLINLECSLHLVDQIFGFSNVEGYEDHVSYFKEISRGLWYYPPRDTYVKWESGNPLGTGPSFGLLTLTNNAAAFCAFSEARKRGVISRELNAPDCFRVVGDDIVMRAEMSDYYTRMIEALGGEVNHSKSLTSNRVAEFAGRVITPTASYLKRVKYSEPSDNSFMSYMSQLGRQAQYFLKPRQRKVWKHFAEVPGVAVDGPWMRDSYGIPFRERYQWYLEEVQPALRRVEPDLPLEDYDAALLRAVLSLESVGRRPKVTKYTPLLEGFQPSTVTTSFRSGGDPRLANGQALVDALNSAIERGHIRSFTEWKAVSGGTSPSSTKSSDALSAEELDFGERDTRTVSPSKPGLHSLDDLDR